MDMIRKWCCQYGFQLPIQQAQICWNMYCYSPYSIYRPIWTRVFEEWWIGKVCYMDMNNAKNRVIPSRVVFRTVYWEHGLTHGSLGKDGSVLESPNLVKNEMKSFLMMPMGFYYISVVLRNYAHGNVRFCIMGVHWSVKDGHLKHFCRNWRILKTLNAYFTISALRH